MLRGTKGLTERRGGARRHGGMGWERNPWVFPRPHRWLGEPGDARSIWTDGVNSRVRELFAIRQTKGGRSFQRLGSPETWGAVY